MISITKYFNNITKYIQFHKEIFYPPQFGCESCGYKGRIHRHGYYTRNVISFFGIHRIYVLRLWCPCCKRTYSILPDFLIPYYQYSFDVIFISLYFMFVLKLSYSKIITLLKALNPSITLCSNNLYHFKKRMHQSNGAAHSFFANYDAFYFDMNKPTIASTLGKVQRFNRHPGHFNYCYALKMPDYFFAKT